MSPNLTTCSSGHRIRSLAVTSMLLCASASHAQATHDHVPSLSPPATAAVPSLNFESTLSRYKSMNDQKLGSWRDANDTVGRIGGWKSYLKEAQEPVAKTDDAPAAADKAISGVKPAAPDPHAGHGAKP